MTKRKTKPASPVSHSSPRARSRFPAIVLSFVAGAMLLSIMAYYVIENRRVQAQREEFSKRRQQQVPSPARGATSEQTEKVPASETRYFTAGNLTMVWDKIKPEVLAQTRPGSTISNVALKDYVGADACADCHKANYEQWSQHPHRWMNATANDQTILGDFSGQAELRYRGGVAKFYRSGNQFRMRYDREDLHREYVISQTIGSRFYQYYVGTGIVGPESKEHSYYQKDHVLPFGYWLDRKTWVPIVHVADEAPEGKRWESVEELMPRTAHVAGIENVGRSRGVFDPTQELGLTYANSCNYCHTTFPLADMFVRFPGRIGETLPTRTLFELSKYVASSHPSIFDGTQSPEQFSSSSIKEMTGTFIAFDAREKAAGLGITCEACHLGCRDHVENPKIKPPFIPQSPNLLTFKQNPEVSLGRDHQNLNAICSRCHIGERPTYAGGMSTWNSTEYTDATKGSCYSQLNCVDCHDPHKPTGKVWPKTPEQDDISCLRCHEKFNQPLVRQSHTHHSAGSAGDRCMNCHMPHINEGIQDVVRTHTIFSPTNSKMLEANHPNACNLCHLDKPIDWTLQHLKSWYGKSFSEPSIKANYPHRETSVGVGWLKQSHSATRLTATAAFARQKAHWALPEIVDSLDDPYLLNRQFAQVCVEQLLECDLNERYGYWYFMNQRERSAAIEAVRDQVRNQVHSAQP